MSAESPGPASHSPSVRLRVIGEVGLATGVRLRSLGGPKPQTLAAALMLNTGTTLPTDQLVHLMWDEPPTSAIGNFRTYVHRIRSTLAGTAAELHGSPTRGYRLEPGDVPVDFTDFHIAAAAANEAAAACDHRAERHLLARALAIWSGPLAAGTHGGSAFAHTVDALSLARVDAEEALLAARLVCGHTDGLAAAITEFLSRHPWRDRAWELLMRTYVMQGDVPAALTSYRQYRQARDEQLGLAPSGQLASLNSAIIGGELVSPAGCRCRIAEGAANRGRIRATNSAPENLSTGTPPKEHPMPMSVDDFTEFAAAATPGLVRSAYLLTGDLGAAEDLVQEALLRTFKHGQRISADGALGSYTRTTMYRLQIGLWRRRRFRTIDIDRLHAHAEPRHDPTAGIPTTVMLHNALAQLPARQRAVVVLRFFEDTSVTETAEVLQCRVGTVKSQTAKALARLRQLVPQLSPQPEGTTT